MIGRTLILLIKKLSGIMKKHKMVCPNQHIPKLKFSAHQLNEFRLINCILTILKMGWCGNFIIVVEVTNSKNETYGLFV